MKAWMSVLGRKRQGILIMLGTVVVAAVTLFALSLSAVGSSQGTLTAREALERRADQAAAERAKWLQTPAVASERRWSQMAYHRLSPQRAQQLFAKTFHADLQRVTSIPGESPRVRGRITRYVTNYVAELSSARGHPEVVVSSAPLRARERDGRLVPIDLSIIRAARGFEARNPAEPVLISNRLAGGVRLRGGFSLTMAGRDAAGSVVSQHAVMYPDVGQDLDAFSVPTINGVEMYAMLRSTDSPHVLSYRLSLPAGASAHMIGSIIAISRGAELLYRIRPAQATDAAGTSVSVQEKLVGPRLVLSIARSGPYAYPILVDPEADGVTSVGWWQFSSTGNSAKEAATPVGAAWMDVNGDSLPSDGTATGCWRWQPPTSYIDSVFYTESDDLRVYISAPVNGGGVNTGGIDWSGGPQLVVAGSPCLGPDDWGGGAGAPQTSSFFTIPKITHVYSDIAPNTQLEMHDGMDAHGGSGQASANPFTAAYVIGWQIALGAAGPVVTANPPPSGPPGTPPPVVTRTAAEQYGTGNAGEPAANNCFGGDPVDCATGNFTEARTDLSFGGRATHLALTRTYNSQRAAGLGSGPTGPFGAGWTAPCLAELRIAGVEHFPLSGPSATTPQYVVVQQNGSEVPFNLGSDGSTISAVDPLTTSSLSRNGDGTYTYTLADQSTLHFGSDGRILSQTDRYGNQLTCNYTPSGQVSSINDGAGRSITFAYATDGSGHIIQAAGPMGTVGYGYDPNGNLTSVTDLDGGVWRFAYDTGHQMTSMTDPLGNRTNNTYTGAQVTSQTDPAGRVTQWAYDPSTTSTTITHPGGSVTRETFNGQGEPLSVTRGSGTPQASTTTTSYDGRGFPETSTDGNGNATTQSYDLAGNLRSVDDPDGNTTAWMYDATHNITSMIDPRGNTTRYAYQNNELTGVTTPDGATTTFSYDVQGDRTSVKSATRHTTTYTYDPAGDMTSSVTPDGATTWWEYDPSGYRTRQYTPDNGGASSPSDPTTAGYKPTIYVNDPFGRPLLTTDPAGNTTQLEYDLDGNLTSETDAGGHTTTHAYTPDNRLNLTTRPDGTNVSYTYNGAGELASQTDGTWSESYAYDPLGRVISTTRPGQRITQSSWDAAGNLSSTTDPAGRTTTFGYDPANLLTSVSYSDRTTPSLAYSYDADGNRTSMTDATGTTTSTYDLAGRLLSSTAGNGSHTAYAYDLDGNVTSLTYPSGQTIHESYDAEDRLTSISDFAANTTNFTYDGNSNLASTAFPTSTGETDRYDYNPNDQLTDINMAKGTTTLASLTYHLHPTGQILTQTESGLPEPATSGTHTNQYDATGNLIELGGQTGYTYNSSGELASSPGATYQYDSNGNRTSATTNAGTASYTYNQANQLTAATTPTGAQDNYTYDGHGLRSTSNDASGANTFAWDTTSNIPTLLSDGKTSYIYGPDGTPIEQIVTTGQTTFLHHDQIGSTRLITDINGAVTGATSYSPYGTVTATAGSSTSALGYAGQYTDPETGLQYLRARYYDPSTGQFITRDPLEELTRQPYSYAGDTPINGTDPSGLCGDPSSWGGFWSNCGSNLVGATAKAWDSSLPGTALNIDSRIASTLTGDTVGYCLGGSAVVGGGETGSVCHVTTASGQACVTASGGFGAGLDISLAASLVVSNARSCGELGRYFNQVGGGYGPISGSHSWGESGGCQITVNGLGLGVSFPPGWPAVQYAQPYTVVSPDNGGP